MIEGVLLTSPKVIENQLGDIHRVIRADDQGYQGFGECYFTEIKKGKTKGWKKHTKMVLNLTVVLGEVKFVIFDEKNNNFQEVVLSKEKNYQRLTVPSNLWVAFHGLGEKNILLNFANIEHDPAESVNKDLKEISYAF